MCPISQTTKEMQNKKLHRLTKCEQCIASRSVEIYSFKCISEKKQIFVSDFTTNVNPIYMTTNISLIKLRICLIHSLKMVLKYYIRVSKKLQYAKPVPNRFLTCYIAVRFVVSVSVLIKLSLSRTPSFIKFSTFMQVS